MQVRSLFVLLQFQALHVSFCFQQVDFVLNTDLYKLVEHDLHTGVA